MWRFLFYLVLLVLSVWIGLHLRHDPGYVLIAYDYWTVEMPLWTGVILLIVGFMLIHWLLRLLRLGRSAGGKLRLWTSRRRVRYARTQTKKGMIDLAEGNWRRAEKNLVKGAEGSDTPLINYLAAAKAAQEQGAYERRDNYLRLAHQVNSDAKIAVGLTQAQLQLHHQQLEQAFATLKHLRELAPQHTYVLKLLTHLYVQLKDWEGLVHLLPEIRHAKILSEAEFASLEQETYINYLAKYRGKADKAIEAVWQTLPKHLKHNADMLNIYCQHLMNSGQGEAAEKLIREALKKDFSKDLIRKYPAIPGVDRGKQLINAEHWLKTHSKNPELLLCLGQLCKANKLWGKARSYLEASLGIKPSREAYKELAELYEFLNETPAALACYKKAMLSIEDYA